MDHGFSVWSALSFLFISHKFIYFIFWAPFFTYNLWNLQYSMGLREYVVNFNYVYLLLNSRWMFPGSSYLYKITQLEKMIFLLPSFDCVIPWQIDPKLFHWRRICMKCISPCCCATKLFWPIQMFWAVYFDSLISSDSASSNAMQRIFKLKQIPFVNISIAHTEAKKTFWNVRNWTNERTNRIVLETPQWVRMQRVMFCEVSSGEIWNLIFFPFFLVLLLILLVSCSSLWIRLRRRDSKFVCHSTHWAQVS